MTLYIKIIDGAPASHPAFEENLLDAFSGNIPAEWEPYRPTPRPEIGPYEVLDELNEDYPSSYTKNDDGSWTIIHPIRPMTDEEKTSKQETVKANWALRVNADDYKSWVFDAEICDFVAPVPKPTEPLPEGSDYVWRDATHSWAVIQIPPDGKWRWNFQTWSLEPVVV